jgi:hypothetical protein
MTRAAALRAASLAVMADPAGWPVYPFLPVVRAHGRDLPAFGLMFDAFGFAGWTGFSATVFLGGLIDLPVTAAGLAAESRETFDTLAEVLDAGWRVE